MISALIKFYSFIWRESNAALFWNSGSDQLGLKKSENFRFKVEICI
jgi:hypothetical protein